jgi:hypothetical protein
LLEGSMRARRLRRKLQNDGSQHHLHGLLLIVVDVEIEIRNSGLGLVLILTELSDYYRAAAPLARFCERGNAGAPHHTFPSTG